MSKKIILIIPLLLCLACTQTYDIERLNAYVQAEKNGMVKTVTRKGYELTLYHRPTDLWVAQELKNEVFSDSLVSSLRKRYSQYLYFILKISRNKKDALYASDNFGDFSDLLQTLSFRMGAYTKMVTSKKDTIPLGDSHYSRLYGRSGSTSVMLAFHKEQIKNTEWVQVDLKDLGIGTGRTVYRFKTSKLLNTPNIDFNQAQY